MDKVTYFLPWIQIILSVILMILILLQQSEAALGSAFGSGNSTGISKTKRGPEKFIFYATIVVAILFAISAIVAFFIV